MLKCLYTLINLFSMTVFSKCLLTLRGCVRVCVCVCDVIKFSRSIIMTFQHTMPMPTCKNHREDKLWQQVNVKALVACNTCNVLLTFYVVRCAWYLFFVSLLSAQWGIWPWKCIDMTLHCFTWPPYFITTCRLAYPVKCSNTAGNPQAKFNSCRKWAKYIGQIK